MHKLSSISAFAPCLNEEKNIPLLVAQFQEVLPKVAKKFEIIIVDDGSTDRTQKIVKQLITKNPEVKYIHHPVNLGYGASLRSGITASQYDWIFFTDGDLQFDLHELEEFTKETQKYNVIIGYREHRADGSRRVLNAKLYKLFIDLLFRLHVRDIDCAFKLIRADLLKPLKLTSTGAFTSAEFLYRLKKKRVKFLQLPVTHLKRKFGTPTGNNPKVVLRAGLEALKLYISMKFGAYFSNTSRTS